MSALWKKKWKKSLQQLQVFMCWSNPFTMSYVLVMFQSISDMLRAKAVFCLRYFPSTKLTFLDAKMLSQVVEIAKWLKIVLFLSPAYHQIIIKHVMLSVPLNSVEVVW